MIGERAGAVTLASLLGRRNDAVRTGLVKICGLREPAHAVSAVAAGADLLGFVFAPARRQVSAETARACISAARRAAGTRRVLAVGVFVDAPADVMNATAEVAGLDLLQVHGAADHDILACLHRPVVKVVRAKPGADVARVEMLIASYAAPPASPVAYLMDGYVEGAHGGTGIRTDWKLAAHLTRSYPLILAGGLAPGNVGEAIAGVAPLAVDVSSGVETDGVKDPAKIAAFVAAARGAFATLAQSDAAKGGQRAEATTPDR